MVYDCIFKPVKKKGVKIFPFLAFYEFVFHINTHASHFVDVSFIYLY